MIYIYAGLGVSRLCLQQTKSMFEIFYSDGVKLINHRDVLNNKLDAQGNVFVMPGGADAYYMKKLSGEGNNIIKQLVNEGMGYIGICAGSYYASKKVIFAEGKDIEVMEGRELGFYPDSVIGPHLADYNYNNYSGARTALINTEIGSMKLFYNGGGYFKNAQKLKNIKILARYQDNEAAIVCTRYGKGKVLLSAIHFEYNPSIIDSNDRDLQMVLSHLQCDSTKRELLNKNLLQDFNIK